MTDNRKRVLEMVASGKISVDEATKLLAALGEETANTPGVKVNTVKLIPRYLRVVVNQLDDESGKPEKVNVRVPVALIRAGMKFSSLIPEEASQEVDRALTEKGIKINLKNLKEEDLEELLAALADLEVDIDGGQGTVKIQAEY